MQSIVHILSYRKEFLIALDHIPIGIYTQVSEQRDHSRKYFGNAAANRC
jgi:hypothetical protein